ncbi:MAG: hypothetical protein ABI594_21460 [Ginsengibacter sp.]
MNVKAPSLVSLQNNKAILAIDLFGGAITDFHLKNIDTNPLSFVFSKEQMPENNKDGAPYQGHFLCLGRWGEPSAGEMKAGLPNHGQVANILWDVEKKSTQNTFQMKVTAPLEGLRVNRKIILDEENAVFAVKEIIQNFNPLGRLYNMVQHPTLAAPFLDETTIVDCNAGEGFDQACYKQIEYNNLHWPLVKDEKQNKIDLRKSSQPYNAVFSFVIKKEDEYGWITAFSCKQNLLFGYVWKRSDYPWIHLWQHYADGTIQYRGIEFGTAGIHQPFDEILNTAPTLFGEKTFAFIDAGESVSKNYFSFIYNTDAGCEGVENINIADDQIQIKTKNGADINFKSISTLINGLSK